MDTQRYRRRESTSPVYVNLAERGKPVLPMAMRVEGWEKAKAILSWDGDGVSHDPTRKRADFPAVSRHENHRGIGREGVAHGGGSFHWCSLPRQGIDFSV